MTQLRSLCIKVVRNHRTSRLRYLCRCPSGLEALWETRRPHYPKQWDITATPLSDLALLSPRRNPGRIAFFLTFPPRKSPFLVAVVCSVGFINKPQTIYYLALCNVLYFIF
jgi:hypothetical protein